MQVKTHELPQSQKQPSRGIKRRRDEKQELLTPHIDAQIKKNCNRGTALER